MTTPRLQRCADCRHFELDPATGQRGFCHRYPPQNVGIATQVPLTGRPGETATQLTTNSSFPIVQLGNWCGEFALALVLGKAN